LAFALNYTGMAGFIFWRGSGSWMAKFSALTLLVFAAAFFNTRSVFSGIMDTLTIVRWLPGLVQALSLGSLLILYYLLPDGRFEPRWTRPLAVVWCAWLLSWFLDVLPGSALDPDRWPEVLRLAAVMGGLGSGVLAQLVRYRRASLPQQRRTRWVVAALTGAVLGFGILWAWALVYPDLKVGAIPMPSALFAFALYLAPWWLIPLAMTFSILRRRLWHPEASHPHSLGRP
jgi:hypothetical protein